MPNLGKLTQTSAQNSVVNLLIAEPYGFIHLAKQSHRVLLLEGLPLTLSYLSNSGLSLNHILGIPPWCSKWETDIVTRTEP